MPNRIAPHLEVEYLAPRFWKNVDQTDPDGCWPWLRSVGSHGYGQTWDEVTVRLAHRVAWTLINGPIPADKTVDHECRLRICCNPAHLRLLSNVENARDNGMAKRTHCPAGHPYDDENTARDRKGHRRCRTCARERGRARYQLTRGTN